MSWALSREPTVLDDYELLEIEVEATNPVNAGGRFTSERSPRLFLGQTRDGNVRRFPHDLPKHIIEELNDVIDGEPVRIDDRPLRAFELVGNHRCRES